MQSDSTINKHIESTPDLCGGRPRIKGTRIRVQDIVAYSEFQGLSPEEIVRGLPHITLADVYAALAYYFDNLEELNQQMKEDDDFVAAMRSELETRSPVPLIPQADPDGDTVSS